MCPPVECARPLSSTRTFVSLALSPLTVHSDFERVLIHIARPRLTVVRRVLGLTDGTVVLGHEREVRAEDSAHDLALIGQTFVVLDPTLTQTCARQVGNVERGLAC